MISHAELLVSLFAFMNRANTFFPEYEEKEVGRLKITAVYMREFDL